MFRRPLRGWRVQRVGIPGARQGKRSGAVATAWRSAMHWAWLVALVAGALIAAFAVRAQPKTQPIAAEETPALAADSALGNAVRAGDKSAARKLLALQFLFVDADGRFYARKEFLDNLKGIAVAAPSALKARGYGLLTAIIGKRASGQSANAFFLDIWARQKGFWRALLSQDVALGAVDAPAVGSVAPAVPGQPYECRNPCQAIPYRVRSGEEQDVILAFQAIEKAVVAHDAEEWGKHIADEFMIYRTGRPPIGKSERMAAIERQKENNAAVTVGEIESMRLAVYGDAAAMLATHASPDKSRPPYRAARVWVKRNGQWLLAISVQTDVK